ncbi:FAD-dependent oxidoreductase [Meridianimarinicoccus sp. RP-17]|uniref:FAD/NAD(P)-dependent oxidoreductase n=1 Tax=Meridianimarinicoccus zhengii TaxID=2056810 RepID=UPI000DAF41A3|nr:NAD(P)/FAD-dependent oxidoreductase [Phycocomes zhengii]
MTEFADLLVLGAGPAGAEAALAADHAGLRVVLLDEAPAAGGQVWRAPRTHAARTRSDADQTRGRDLRGRLDASGVQVRTGTQVWDAVPGFCLSCVSERGATRFQAPRLVLATGATERVRPFAGWTTPGVFGLAAATAMMKAEGRLAGRNIIVAGQGPLLIAVAAKACAMGVPPRAIVDLNGRGDWLSAVSGFAAAPGLLLTGLKWMARIVAARVPILHGADIVRALGDDTLDAVIVRDRASGQETRLAADTLYVGNGLTPADEIHRLLGAAQVADALRGGYRTLCDADRRSSVPGLYVAGDGAGVHGAFPSAAQGRIAGLAAAHDHGALSAADFARASRHARGQLKRLMRFADASCRLMQFPEDSLQDIRGDTVICRCEDVTVDQIRAASGDGACDLNQLKHFTRLGMGPCQGRMCALNAAGVLRRLAVDAGRDLRLTPRAPVRPVEMAQLIGTFAYSDIPVPKPAPL